LRDFAKLWLFKLIIVVVVNFISGLLKTKKITVNQKKDAETKRYTLKHAHCKKTLANALKRAHGRCT